MALTTSELAKIEAEYQAIVALIEKGDTDFKFKTFEWLYNLIHQIQENENITIIVSHRSYSYDVIPVYWKNLMSDVLSKKYDDVISFAHIFDIIYFQNDTSINILSIIKSEIALAYQEFKNYYEIFLANNARNKNTQKYPYSIQNLVITQFNNIKQIALCPIPSNKQFIVFTGENGRGKSSILQAIASSWHESNSEKSNVFIDYVAKDKNIWLINGRTYRNISLQVNLPFPLIAYGASRLNLQSPESNAVAVNGDVDSLFNPEAHLQNIEYQFGVWKLREEEDKIIATQKVLRDLLPQIEEIVMEKEKVFYIENGTKVEASALSAGQKSIVAMIGDLIIRLYKKMPEVKDVADFEGIVLIDELEAHLHPKWQKEFPKLLAKHFPKIQFIVTTHSPIPFLGMPENTVFYRVIATKEEGVKAERIEVDIKNMLPNHILTSPIFDMEDIQNEHNDGIQKLYVEDTYQEIIEKEETKKRIKELAKKFQFKPPTR